MGTCNTAQGRYVFGHMCKYFLNSIARMAVPTDFIRVSIIPAYFLLSSPIQFVCFFWQWLKFWLNGKSSVVFLWVPPYFSCHFCSVYVYFHNFIL
jgi:hypothetical protein